MTFWTHFWHFHYLQMPFGISSASEEFQWRMHSTLQGLSGVEVIIDDILFYRCGRTDKECQKDMTQTYNVFYNEHETKTYSLIKEAQTLLTRSYLHETPLN